MNSQKEPRDGELYVTDTYTYSYKCYWDPNLDEWRNFVMLDNNGFSIKGWGVKLNSMTTKHPEPFLSEIRGYPVVNAEKLFCEYFSEEPLDLRNFDTSNILIMKGMFNNCRVTSINLAGIDTSQVIAMDSMFKGYCGEIFGLHSLNTKNVCQYDSMFVSCQTPVIECSAFDIPVSKNGALVSTLYMFSWCDTEVLSLNGVDCSRLASNAFMNTTVDTIYAKSDKDVKEIGWRLSGSEHKKTVRFIVNTIPEIGTVLIDDSGIEYRYGLHWDGLTWSTPKTPLNAWSAKTTSHNLAGIPNQIDGLAVVS